MNDGRDASCPAHPRDSPSDPWAGLPAKRGPVAAPGGGIPGPGAVARLEVDPVPDGCTTASCFPYLKGLGCWVDEA
jgi:hypothetical protein